MWNRKNLIFVIIYTILFSALIFTGRSIFFSYPWSEERFIEPSLDQYSADYGSFTGVTQEDVNSAMHDLIYKEFKEKHEHSEQEKIQIRSIPSSLFEKIQYSYIPLVETFLYNKSFLSKIADLKVLLYKNEWDTRWRMKAKHIHMYGVTNMSDEEFLSVLVHEFAHYIDIYSFPNSSFWDESQKFYDISWDSVTVMKKWLVSEDFVSWYAMTNWYEDFAESYTYYIFHNTDFLQKSQGSDILAQKYDFFQKYVFSQNMFHKENFSLEEEYKPYYWDVTKISIDVKKFLHYLQNTL